MNPYASLAKELDEAGINMGYIRINETPRDSSFCILNYEPEIECFYWERGAKSEMRTFNDSESAIKYFKAWVLSIKPIYKNWGGAAGNP